MRVVLKCQHCGHKNYQPLERGVSYKPCAKCGQQTSAKPTADGSPSRRAPRTIDNPAA